MTTVFGSVPVYLTTNTVADIQAKYLTVPELQPGYRVPLSTYLLFAQQGLRFDLSTIYSIIFSEKMFKRFKDNMPVMSEAANTQAVLDARSFESEVSAFNNIEQAVREPHLDISELYRYMVAMQRGLVFCVDDTMIAKAIDQLRRNPYLYLAYGEPFYELMPIGWEEL